MLSLSASSSDILRPLAGGFGAALQALAVGRVQAGPPAGSRLARRGVDRRPAVNGRPGVDFGAHAPGSALRQFGPGPAAGRGNRGWFPLTSGGTLPAAVISAIAASASAQKRQPSSLLGDQVDQPVRVTARVAGRAWRSPGSYHENLGRVDADQSDRKAVGQGHGDGRLCPRWWPMSRMAGGRCVVSMAANAKMRLPVYWPRRNSLSS